MDTLLPPDKLGFAQLWWDAFTNRLTTNMTFRKEIIRFTEKELEDCRDEMAEWTLLRMRSEYIIDLANLAARIAVLQEYFQRPWYKRIFTRPHVIPQAR